MYRRPKEIWIFRGCSSNFDGGTAPCRDQDFGHLVSIPLRHAQCFVQRIVARRLRQRAAAERTGRRARRLGGLLGALDAWWTAEREAPARPGAGPFCGGWFLYLGYELAAEIEPRLRFPASGLLRAVAWRMRGALVRDRSTGAVIACAETGLQPQLEAWARRYSS
jgi:hypothetical protein